MEGITYNISHCYNCCLYLSHFLLHIQFGYGSFVVYFLFVPGYMETSMEKHLIRTLISEYEARGKQGRPIAAESDTLDVYYGLSLIQILDLDERNQVLSTNVWASYVSIRQKGKYQSCHFKTQLSFDYYTDYRSLRIFTI